MTKNVKTIFKTHLDVGFTDLAANVIDCYMEKFIPSAIRTAGYFKRQPGGFRYRWTVASWLIYEYLLRNKGKKRHRLEQAIAASDIVWHALPFTSHSELADR
ncbi:MAG: hypothetical protein NT118_02165 [Lentisphaerae bacterium]|nr:hypothetical protein [Lentisphaerota bacterium]